MSTLLDRLRRHTKFPGLDDAMPVIIATNVARLLHSCAVETTWRTQDVPNIAPPFFTFFVEARPPSQLGNHRDGFQSWPHPGITAYGVRCIGFDEGVDRALQHFCQTPEKLQEALRAAGGRDAVRWALGAVLYIENYGREYYPVGQRLVLLDEHGAPLGVELHQMIEGAPPYRLPTLHDAQSREACLLYQVMYTVAFVTVCFMHCPTNVQVVEHEPDAPLQRKSLKKHGRPLSRYYTLQIAGMEEVLRTEGGMRDVGMKQALHFCRGHFKTYREKGLFSKLPGTFFFPAHLRGTPTRGVVRKDYEVAGESLSPD